MVVAVLIAFVIAPAQASQPVKEGSQVRTRLLERAFLQRSDFKTAQFKLRVESQKRDRLPYVQHLEISLADGNWTIRNTGDDHGLVHPPRAGQFDESAHVGVGSAFLPLIHFLDGTTKDWYSFADSARSVVFHPGRLMPTFVDPRTYGLRAIVIQNQNPKQIADMMFASGAIQYSEKSLRDGIVKVSGHQPADSPKGYQIDYEWDIDKENGPSVLMVREFVTHPDGRRELVAESINDLSLIEDRWWPMKTEIKILSTGRSFKVEFSRVEFDHPEHPQRLSPDSIGIPVGLPVRMPGESGKLFYAGGGAVIDEATFEREKSKLDLGPLAAHTAHARARGFGQFPDWWNGDEAAYGIAGVADRPDLWELYVRRWIMKRSPNSAEVVVEPVTDEQKTSAQGILNDCRKRAVPYRLKLDAELTRVGRDIDALEKELGIALPAPGQPTRAANSKSTEEKSTPRVHPQTTQPSSGKDAVNRLAALRERKAALEYSAEIQRLFDELKLRLDGMLTSAQRDPNSITPRQPPPRPVAARAPAGK